MFHLAHSVLVFFAFIVPFSREADAASVTFKACPLNKLTECPTCPTSADLSSLTQVDTTFPGALVGGTFVPHTLGPVDPRPYASKLTKWDCNTPFTIEQCCAACIAEKDCGFWSFRPTLGDKENSGSCDIFSSTQCSTSQALRRYVKWRTYDSTTFISFRRCNSQESTTLNSPPPPPVALHSPSPVFFSSPGILASSPPQLRPSPSRPSQPALYPPPVTSYGHCPRFPSCTRIPFCPDTSTLKGLFADPGSYPDIKRGKMTPAVSGATGNTLLANVGYMSMGDCCQSCGDRWQDDCWLWNWQHQPKADNFDWGECRLFVTQACAFMTEDGFQDQNVWDSSQAGYFASVSPC